MEKNKYTLITIILLLVFILPFTIYGTYKHFITTTNFKRQFKFNGKLWFYNGKKLIGTYDCKSKSCDYAIYTNEQKSNMINNLFAFIADDGKIYLYNIKDKSVINEYEAVSADAEYNNYFVMQSDEEGNEKWGALEITNDVSSKIEPKYKSIYYLNGKYIVPIEGSNAIVESKGENQEEVLFSTSYNIKDFNDKYIIVYYQTSSCETCDDVIIQDMLLDYDDNMYFANRYIDGEMSFVGDYILVKNQSHYNLYEIKGTISEEIIAGFVYEGNDEITYNITDDNKIEFYAGGELQKTVELKQEQ